ncbi:MAG: recombinase family protein [Polyangiales bacterium]
MGFCSNSVAGARLTRNTTAYRTTQGEIDTQKSQQSARLKHTSNPCKLTGTYPPKRLPEVCKRDADCLAVVKLDRRMRSVKDLGTLVETCFSKGPELVSVSESIDTESAAGRLVLNVLCSVAQWEREAVGERTSAALQHKKANHEYTGGVVPYGYRVATDSSELRPVSDEQDVIATAKTLHAQGRTLRSVAKGLSLRGYVSRSGKAFGPNQVRSMLASSS